MMDVVLLREFLKDPEQVIERGYELLFFIARACLAGPNSAVPVPPSAAPARLEPDGAVAPVR